MAAQVRIGASGFSYKEWLGGFYPPKLPGAKMLAYYAERLPTVEINYTFRAMPRRAMLERWAGQTPAQSSQPMHFSIPSSYRLRTWRPCSRSGLGIFSFGYSVVSRLSKSVLNVTVKPLR